MPLVRTVTGIDDATRIGVVDAHDHLVIDAGPGTDRDPDLLLDDLAEAEDELRAFASAGGGCVVDCMPRHAGGNWGALYELSRRTGVRVIATAGFHRRAYYADPFAAQCADPQAAADLLLRDCAGVELTDGVVVRPGLLKAPFGYWGSEPVERNWQEAVAAAHHGTGLPVLLHLEHGVDPIGAVTRMTGLGVEPQRLVLSHVDRSPDAHACVEAARTGAYLSLDGLYRERYRPLSAVTDLIRRLAEAGLAARVLVGGDLARRSLRRRAGTPGLAGLLTHWAQRLRLEFGDDLVRTVFHDNPAAAFALAGEPRAESE